MEFGRECTRKSDAQGCVPAWRAPADWAGRPSRSRLGGGAGRRSRRHVRRPAAPVSRLRTVTPALLRCLMPAARSWAQWIRLRAAETVEAPALAIPEPAPTPCAVGGRCTSSLDATADAVHLACPPAKTRSERWPGGRIRAVHPRCAWRAGSPNATTSVALGQPGGGNRVARAHRLRATPATAQAGQASRRQGARLRRPVPPWPGTRISAMSEAGILLALVETSACAFDDGHVLRGPSQQHVEDAERPLVEDLVQQLPFAAAVREQGTAGRQGTSSRLAAARCGTAR